MKLENVFKESELSRLLSPNTKSKSMLYHYIPQFEDGFLCEPCKTGINSKHEFSTAKYGMN